MSNFISTGNPYGLMELSKHLITSFVSVDSHIQTTGQLIVLSIPIIKSCSSFAFSFYKLLGKLFCNSFAVSVNTSMLTFAIHGHWYLKFLPELTQGAHVLHLLSVSICIPDHQKFFCCRPTFSSNSDDRSVVLPPLFSTLRERKFYRLQAIIRKIQLIHWKSEQFCPKLILSDYFRDIIITVVLLD